MDDSLNLVDWLGVAQGDTRGDRQRQAMAAFKRINIYEAGSSIVLPLQQMNHGEVQTIANIPCKKTDGTVLFNT